MMFGMGPGCRRLRGNCGCRRILLSECEAGARGEVIDNTGTRSMEMGFFPGAMIDVLSNTEGTTSLVVLTGESRFVVSREIAETVVVRLMGGRWRQWGGRKC